MPEDPDPGGPSLSEGLTLAGVTEILRDGEPVSVLARTPIGDELCVVNGRLEVLDKEKLWLAKIHPESAWRWSLTRPELGIRIDMMERVTRHSQSVDSGGQYDSGLLPGLCPSTDDSVSLLTPGSVMEPVDEPDAAMVVQREIYRGPTPAGVVIGLAVDPHVPEVFLPRSFTAVEEWP